MDRRQVLVSLPVGLLVSGCVEATSGIRKQNGTDTPTQRQSQPFMAEIIEVRYAKQPQTDGATPPRGDDGNYRQTVTATFDCAEKTILVDGWLFTSSCRRVTIKSRSYDEADDRLTLVLFPKWDDPKPPEKVDCAGAKYHYRIQVTAQNTLPGEIRVVYEWPDGEQPTRFTVPNDEC